MISSDLDSIITNLEIEISKLKILKEVSETKLIINTKNNDQKYLNEIPIQNNNIDVDKTIIELSEDNITKRITEEIINNVTSNIKDDYNCILDEITKIKLENKSIKEEISNLNNEINVETKSINKSDESLESDYSNDEYSYISKITSPQKSKKDRLNSKDTILDFVNFIPIKKNNKQKNQGNSRESSKIFKYDTYDLMKPAHNQLYNYENKKDAINNYLNDPTKKKTLRYRVMPEDQIIDSQGYIFLFPVYEPSYLSYLKLKNNVYISDESSFSQSWNMLILLIMLFLIIIFPFEIFSETWLNSYDYYVFTNVVFEWVFVLDIFVNFLTSQRDQYGHTVKDLNSIAINYLNTWFSIDIIASIPANNLIQYNFVNTDQNNAQIRAFRLPKQIRMFRAWINIFSSRIANSINLDAFGTFTNSQVNLQFNTIKYAAQFLLISNTLVCQNISFTSLCDEQSNCSNWFFYLMQSQFDYSIANITDSQHKIAIDFYDNNSYEFAVNKFQNKIWNDRRLLQINSWYFVLQTVTTVGYGDVGTNNSDERIFRSLCMIIGVILFTLLSTSVLETTITDTLNIYKSKEHEAMIEKLEIKYNMKGDSKRQLNLLGDSVQTEPLKKELQFAKLLPRYMSDKVLNHIWNLQKNKMSIFKDENIQFFVEFLMESKFRRCVFDENIESNHGKISFLYSGQIGCYLAHSRSMLQHDQLYYVDIGGEIGWFAYLDQPKSSQNQVQTCITNSELVEIPADKLYNLIIKSVKGFDQILQYLEEFFVEIWMVVAIYYSMLSVGEYIDTNWYQKTIVQLNLREKDFKIMDRLSFKLAKNMSFEELLNEEKIPGKWQCDLFCPETIKYVRSRSRETMVNKINHKQSEVKISANNYQNNKIKRN